MLDELINQSKLSSEEKEKARCYATGYKKGECYYGTPSGAVELFRIILGDVDEEAVNFYNVLSDKFTSSEDSGGYDGDVYNDLNTLTNNDFSVDNFKIVIDGLSDTLSFILRARDGSMRLILLLQVSIIPFSAT